MKKTFFMPFVAIALAMGFASCANEDEILGENTQDANNVTVFTNAEDFKPSYAPAPGVHRTSMDKNGSFFWTNGDKIFVKNGTSYVLSNNAADTKKARENFYFNGTYTANTYPVIFTGTGNSKYNQVVVKAAQTQTTPNDATHIGTDGDCGTAVATKKDDLSYTFDLKHRATYFNITPRHQLNATNVTLEKIVITTTASDNLCGTYTFSENTETLWKETVTNGGKTITVTTGSFKIPAVAAADADASLLDATRVFVVLQPGIHTLKFTYTVKVDGTTKTYVKNVAANRSFKWGHFTNVKHILSDGLFNGGHETLNVDPEGELTDDAEVFDYTSRYFMWDAPANSPYVKKSQADYSTVAAPTQASRSCKDMPNANEYYWYVHQGGPRWDKETPWTMDGGLTEYTGGIWLMKKDHIISLGRTFDATKGLNDKDMRSTAYTHYYVTSENYRDYGRPANTTNYFFVPAMGHYTNDGAHKYAGQCGYYWSKSPYYNKSDWATLLYFDKNQLEILGDCRWQGNIAGTGIFQ